MKINYSKVVILFFTAGLLLFCSGCSSLHDKLVIASIVHKCNKVKRIDFDKIEDKRRYVESDSISRNEWTLREEREGRDVVGTTDKKTGEFYYVSVPKGISPEFTLEEKYLILRLASENNPLILKK